MLHLIKIENVLSYKKATLDFYASSKTENEFLPSSFGHRITPVAAIFGNNASGKTNLVEALRLLVKNIVHSFRDQKVFYSPHATLTGEPSSFSVVVELNGNLFEYELVIQKKKVLKEQLRVKGPKRRYRRVFLRESRTIKIGSQYTKDYPLKGKNLPEFCTAISLLYHSGFSPINDFYRYFEKVFIYSPERPPRFFFWDHTLKSIKEGPREQKAFILKMLEVADVGIKQFSILKPAEKPYWGVEFIHEIEGQKVKFRHDQESEGTIYLFLLSLYLYTSLRTGSPVILDQIEGYIHPWTWEYIVNLFKNPENNASRAQLIFTTHCPTVMDVLEKEEVWLVKKAEGVSEIYSAKDFKGLSPTTDLKAFYLSGKLGAVPGC